MGEENKVVENMWYWVRGDNGVVDELSLIGWTISLYIYIYICSLVDNL